MVPPVMAGRTRPIREGYSVALVMAGLPSDVTDLIADERVTFLRRARQQYIGRIEDGEVKLALRRSVEAVGKTIEPEALEFAAASIGGFAYMLQLVGYFMWEEAWMSEKDLAFALAMLDDSDGSRLVDIAARMDVTNGYASTYKRRLLKKGVVGERPGGRLDFDIPLLREYLDEFYTE